MEDSGTETFGFIPILIQSDILRERVQTRKLTSIAMSADSSSPSTTGIPDYQQAGSVTLADYQETSHSPDCKELAMLDQRSGKPSREKMSKSSICPCSPAFSEAYTTLIYHPCEYNVPQVSHSSSRADDRTDINKYLLRARALGTLSTSPQEDEECLGIADVAIQLAMERGLNDTAARCLYYRALMLSEMGRWMEAREALDKSWTIGCWDETRMKSLEWKIDRTIRRAFYAFRSGRLESEPPGLRRVKRHASLRQEIERADNCLYV